MRRLASISVSSAVIASVVALAGITLSSSAEAKDLGEPPTGSGQLIPPTDLKVASPDNDSGRNIKVSWQSSPSAASGDLELSYLVFRTPYAAVGGPPELRLAPKVGQWLDGWQLVYKGADSSFDDDVFNVPMVDETSSFVFTLTRPADLEARRAEAKSAQERAEADADARAARAKTGHFIYAIRAVEYDDKGRLMRWSDAAVAGPVATKTSYLHTDRWFYGSIILLMGFGLLFYFIRIKRDPDNVFIRRIAGVDAIEDAVGRSTEMGRPVLYVTGTDDVQNIQTIASLLVLGRVAEMTAEYDTEIKVANLYPLTMVVAEEIVRQGFADAGRIDAHKPENVMFISAEQFAFAAGINGIILRDKPATNIYLGRFFAESLILAETGYVTGAVQIAGTAEIPQLPFFVAACDYTLIGEELYAVSAYLTREPGLLAMLKATDMVKAVVMALIIVGMLLNLGGIFDLREVLFP